MDRQNVQGQGRTSALGAFGLGRGAWLALIDEWIFSERERDILKRRMLDGLTYEAVADEFGMSPRQIKTICRKRLDELIRHI